MGDAAERWRMLVEGRLEEMERLQSGQGALDAQFWDRRARRMATGPMASAAGDPMLARLRRAVGRGRTATVLDVGAGPGRFTVAIAPSARQVTAVDPSRRMLQLLRRRAREAGAGNVATVTGPWMEVDVEPADVVLCSHVLPLVADVVPFVEKLQAMARREVLLSIGSFASDAVLDPFWRRFHGSPRRPGAGWLDALAVLEEMGIDAAVKIVELRAATRHATLAEAVESYREQLVLPRSPEVRRELTRLLDLWLQRRGEGLYAPFRSHPAAVISWKVQ